MWLVSLAFLIVMELCIAINILRTMNERWRYRRHVAEHARELMLRPPSWRAEVFALYSNSVIHHENLFFFLFEGRLEDSGTIRVGLFSLLLLSGDRLLKSFHW